MVCVWNQLRAGRASPRGEDNCKRGAALWKMTVMAVLWTPGLRDNERREWMGFKFGTPLWHTHPTRLVYDAVMHVHVWEVRLPHESCPSARQTRCVTRFD